MKANVFHGRMRIWWFLICFTLTFIYFEGDAYGSPPAISIITPLDEDTASAPYMDMEISVSADTYPLTFWLYGDTVSAPAELLYVQEGITGPTTIPITWDALTLRPEASTVGLWHFDDNFGITTADISSYGNDGTMINGAQWTDDGRFGYAVAFDGTDDYISIPDLDNSLDVDPTTGALTIEAWINPNAIGGNTYRGFISKRDSALATQVNYSLYLNNTNGALSFYNGTFPAGFYVSSVIPSLNTWTYIAVTLDATESTLRFYRNGELEDAITGTTFGPAHDGRLTIGTSQTPTGNRCFSGMIDEVRITTRQLSDDDIAANYGLRRDYYSWSATATDAGMESSATAEQHFTIGLMMMPLSDGSVPEGGTLVVDVTAANPDDATINLTMSALDNGTFVDHGDGTGTLTFMPDYDQAGDHSVTFYADDGLESVARTINIAVTNTNRPPDVTDIPDQSTEEGGSYPMLELSGCCNDPDVPIDDAIEWTSTDGTNLDISITGCEVTVTILDENWHGQETITFRATDLGGLYDEDDVTFMVTGVNDAPLVDDILDNDIVICNEITLAVSGSDIDGIVSEVSASASPSGSLPEGASFTDYGDGTGLFVWTPTPDQPGIYPLRFTVVDDSGATAYDDVTVTVNDDIAPPAVTLIAPSNGYTTSDQTMDLSTTLSDDGPLTVLVYGGRDPDEMILLDISENITDNTFTYNWIHPLMLPDPVTTMGLWRLDEFTGYFTYDDGNFGNDGQISGTLPVWITDGRFGYAIDFNGTDNFISINDDPSLDIDSATGALTMEAWIFPHTDADYPERRGIIAKLGHHDNNGPCNYQLCLNDENYLTFFTRGTDGTGHTHVSSVHIPPDQWSAITFTLDATEGRARFYLNGILGDEIDGVAFGPAHDRELTFGISAREIECFDGIIDQVRLTRRVMDDNEILRNYNSLGGGTMYWEIAAYDCAGNETAAGPWSFTIVDNLAPRFTYLDPPNGVVAIYSHMDLTVDTWDESRMTLYIFGDATPSASDLLYVTDNFYSTTVTYDWTVAVFEPEPPYTAGLWHFDDIGADTVCDESFNNNIGAFYGAPKWTTNGRFGYALEFDGVHDYISVPDNPSLDIDSATGALTLEAWINPDQVGGGVYHAFISKRGSGPGDPDSVNYALYLDDADGSLTFFSGDFPNRYYISNIIPPVNEWSYIAVTLNASEGILRFYLNGVLEQSISGAAFGPPNGEPLTIGVSETTTQWRYFDGMIDEVRITKRALGKDEIAANFELQKSTYYWRVYAVDEFNNVAESETRYFTTNLFVCGDANGDGDVNLGDPVYIISYVFKGGPAPDPIESGDANGDHGTNVGDAVFLIQYIFVGGPPPVCP